MTRNLRLDLHVHSRHSPDSRLSVAAIVERLPYAGLGGFALTDHNSTAGHSELRALAREHPEYLFVPGVEVSTAEGHLLLYGVEEAPPVRRPLAEIVDWARARAAVAVLAHPFRRSHGVGARVASIAPVDGVEIVNGHSTVVANARAQLVASRRSLATTGGSDAHHDRDLGRAVTEFPDGVETADDAVAALARRTVRAEGHSMTVWGQLRWSVRTGLLRASRGFRPI